MFEHYDANETVRSNNSFNDADVPEPLEHWSLDDFQDLLPSTSK